MNIATINAPIFKVMATDRILLISTHFYIWFKSKEWQKTAQAKKRKKKNLYTKSILMLEQYQTGWLCMTKIAIRITLFCWYRKYCKLIANRHPEDTSFQICTTSNQICTTACVYRKSLIFFLLHRLKFQGERQKRDKRLICVRAWDATLS